MMSDYENEYERDEQLLEARRLKRLELKRKRHKQKQILACVCAAVVILAIALVFRSCGKSEKTPKPVDPTPVEPVAQTKPDSVATLSAVGDIMVYDTQIADALQSDGTYNFLPALAQVSELLTASDVTVGNFEANFAGAPFVGYPNFSAPPEFATTLAGLGFDILQTANTYTVQNGLTGLSGTINTVRGAGMNSLGSYLSADDRAANEVVVKEVNGIRMAFIGMTKGLNNMTLPTGAEYAVDVLYTDYYTNYSKVDKTAINELVDAAKATKPDVIIAMVHWGSEYDTAVSATQDLIADTLFQRGVDVILGTHSHIVGPMEKRTVAVDGKQKDVFVAYSLGNFFSGMDKENTQASAVLNLEFTKSGKSGETTISNVEYVPLYLMDNGAEATNRYEVRSIERILQEETDAAVLQKAESALTLLKRNTASDFAKRAPAVTPPVTEEEPDTAQGGTKE